VNWWWIQGAANLKRPVKGRLKIIDKKDDAGFGELAARLTTCRRTKAPATQLAGGIVLQQKDQTNFRGRYKIRISVSSLPPG
jgi:hypothetical protein